MESILMIVVMVAVFYFMLIRPENKRKRAAEDMRNSLKKGERVTTIGGIVGKVVQVNDSSIIIETSEDRVRMEIAKWGVQSTESMEKAAAEQQQQKGSRRLFGKSGEDAKEEPEKAEKDKSFDPELK